MSRDVLETFNLDVLTWAPWLERADETDLAPEQREQVVAVVGNSPIADYIAVLANDLPALKTRARVHVHHFTSNDPEPASYRELGATTASRINGCHFCASGHALMYAALSDKRDVAQRLMDDGVDADLPRLERAIVELATKVTNDPESLSAADFTRLRDLGFDDLGILDVINYSAFFGNATRLTLSLGEPKLRE